jgi:hypothetical protein
MFDQPSTHYRADAGSDRAKARPGSDRATAFVLCERTADDGKTAGNEERRAKSLKCAGGDQLSDVGGKSARSRGARKKRDPDQKNAATPVVIAERTANEEKRGEQERVGFDDPLKIDRGGVEARLQRGQCDIHDSAIDERHAGSENSGGENPAAARFRARRCRRSRPDYVLVTRFSEEGPHNRSISEES